MFSLLFIAVMVEWPRRKALSSPTITEPFVSFGTANSISINAGGFSIKAEVFTSFFYNNTLFVK